MVVYSVRYDSWFGHVFIFSTFEKAKEDIINYVNNPKTFELDWNLEDVKRDFEEITTELYGYDTWEEGLRACSYADINYFLGDFASIEKIEVDVSFWG